MNIAIAGYGVEGKQSYAYYNAQGGHSLTILDQRPELDDIPAGAKIKLGDEAYKNLEQYDMVVRTAGLSPRKLEGAQKVWSATNEFFARCPAPIIGVTGTKGKGTTSSYIASILREAGIATHLVGNIGVPALKVLSDIEASDVVVYELSSFQLWDVEKSPHIAVVLMIEPDHLDVHADLTEYVSAKANIVRHQQAGDVCFYHPTNQFSEAIAKQQPEQVNSVAAFNNPALLSQSVASVYVKDGMFVTTDGNSICATSEVKLPGEHNLENACAALSACLLYVSDYEAMRRGLAGFTGLDHRLKFVAQKAGVSFYDDSIATTPGSALAAIKAFLQPKVLILGGSPKGADFTELAQTVAQSRVRQVVLIGQEAERIAEALRSQNVSEFVIVTDVSMMDIVHISAQYAKPGDVVILSPACASFGMFNNYQDRGQQFIDAVQTLDQ